MTVDSPYAIQAIAEMSAPQIIREWERVHGAPAPAIAPSLLARDLAHRLQAEASGGVDKCLERRLHDLAMSSDERVVQECHRKALGHGTQLLREWGGQTHRVTVEADGRYAYAGTTWRSLSAIAYAITGAHWSGPRFFGTRA
jgi:Protein of unknown function (DUF2924)